MLLPFSILPVFQSKLEVFPDRLPGRRMPEPEPSTAFLAGLRSSNKIRDRKKEEKANCEENARLPTGQSGPPWVYPKKPLCLVTPGQKPGQQPRLARNAARFEEGNVFSKPLLHNNIKSTQKKTGTSKISAQTYHAEEGWGGCDPE